MDEVLAGDPQLAEEITFDLKRFDEEQKKVAAQATPIVTTPQSLMVKYIAKLGLRLFFSYVHMFIDVTTAFSWELDACFHDNLGSHTSQNKDSQDSAG